MHGSVRVERIRVAGSGDEALAVVELMVRVPVDIGMDVPTNASRTF